MDPFDLGIVFFGGKGGVGKTTCASAYALLSAKRGRKTLLVSTDPAHSLSDMFGTEIGNKETRVEPALFALEIDPDHEANDYIRKAKTQAERLVEREAFEFFSKQMDLAVHSPGIQEAALFDKITNLITRTPNPYDLVVFDTAPTGQTLRLLALPGQMGTWTRILAGRREKVSSLWKMFSRASQRPVEEDAVMGLLEERRSRLDKTKTLLSDPSRTGFYLVLIPERIPILETKKAIPILERHRIPIRGIIVNRLLPENIEGAYFRKRKAQEGVYLEEIRTLFHPRKPVYLHQRESDVMNPEGLHLLGPEMEAALEAAG